MSCIRPNCTFGAYNGTGLQPNSDVSGVGVLIGFMVTAYLTAIIVVVHYVITDDTSSILPQKKPNPIDRGIKAFLWRNKTNRPSEEWSKALQQVVLMFSDQQIVTGLAILTAGYYQLHCSLFDYHWQIIIYLAWFSSFTHLTTLTLLRDYFKERRQLRNFRIGLMLALAILLIVGLIPTGGFEANTVRLISIDTLGRITLGHLYPWGIPAQCFFKALDPRSAAATMQNVNYKTGDFSWIVSICLLCVSYFSRILQLSQTLSDKAENIQVKYENIFKQDLDRTTEASEASLECPKLMLVWHRTLLATYILLQGISDTVRSMFYEILWLLITLCWGTTRQFTTRSSVKDSINQAEDYLAYGQLVPVLFLILPCLSISDICYDAYKAKSSENGLTVTANAPEASLVLALADYEIDYYQFQWYRFPIILLILFLIYSAVLIISPFQSFLKIPGFSILATC